MRTSWFLTFTTNISPRLAIRSRPSSLNNFALPFWLLNFQELTAALTTSDEDRDAEAEILSEGVRFARRRYTDGVVARGSMLRRASDAAVTTIETPDAVRLSDVIGYIDEQLGKLERVQLTLPYRKLKARIETMISDPRYGFMFGSLTVQDTMAEILGRLFRVPGGWQTNLRSSICPWFPPKSSTSWFP